MRRGYVRLGKEQGEGLPGSTDHDEGIDRVTRSWPVGLINLSLPDTEYEIVVTVPVRKHSSLNTVSVFASTGGA